MWKDRIEFFLIRKTALTWTKKIIIFHGFAYDNEGTVNFLIYLSMNY